MTRCTRPPLSLFSPNMLVYKATWLRTISPISHPPPIPALLSPKPPAADPMAGSSVFSLKTTNHVPASRPLFSITSNWTLVPEVFVWLPPPHSSSESSDVALLRETSPGYQAKMAPITHILKNVLSSAFYYVFLWRAFLKKRCFFSTPVWPFFT